MDQEPARVSSAILFKQNILDPTISVSATLVFLITHSLTSYNSFIAFLVIFTCLYCLISHQIKSYRLFKTTNRCVKILSADPKLLRAFSSAHIGARFSTDKSVDTFRWANRVISFFWPYLTHVLHYQLNEFLKRSNSLAHDQDRSKRLLHAMIRQMDTNLISVEKCQLGARAPFIKSLTVSVKLNNNDRNAKSVIYDLDIAYEGNMNMLMVCRYFCCYSSRLGLKDLFIRSKFRITVGPIHENAPLIKHLTLTLLKLPEFGYKGIAVVELARLRVARRAINRLIRTYLLHPQQVSIAIPTLFQTLKERPPEIIMKSKSNEGLDSPPLGAKFLAKVLFSWCICSNYCLRVCRGDSTQIDQLGE